MERSFGAGAYTSQPSQAHYQVLKADSVLDETWNYPGFWRMGLEMQSSPHKLLWVLLVLKQTSAVTRGGFERRSFPCVFHTLDAEKASHSMLIPAHNPCLQWMVRLGASSIMLFGGKLASSLNPAKAVGALSRCVGLVDVAGGGEVFDCAPWIAPDLRRFAPFQESFAHQAVRSSDESSGGLLTKIPQRMLQHLQARSDQHEG